MLSGAAKAAQGVLGARLGAQLGDLSWPQLGERTVDFNSIYVPWWAVKEV